MPDQAHATPHVGAPPSRPTGIDPRGPRFGAGLSAALLAAVVVLGDQPAGVALLALAVLLFAVGAVRGAQGSLQGVAFRTLVRPRLAPPAELEDPAPPRFAQVVGLAVTGTGLVLGVLGVGAAVPVAAAVALVAAFLNAAFGFCLGCEVYLLLQRVRTARA